MIRFDTKKDMEHYDNLYHKIFELEQENKQLKETIDKAIEYIKTKSIIKSHLKSESIIAKWFLDDLLEILRGKK